ncbi:MAG: Hsp20/alpha crystallin family protein [Candidatus Latescibacteria bacterium]|nr:Hsp20/alpha crystallin family protein [Candidatus Latescibacterota bacterium]
MLPEIWKNRGSLVGPSMDDFIEKFFYGWPRYEKDADFTWSPRVDVHETEKEIYVDVELPGLEKKDIAVEVKDNSLTVSGERKYERNTKDSKCYTSERHYGRFERTFGLSDSVNADEISAKFKNGILTLTLPKTEKAIPKEISVEVK